MTGTTAEETVGGASLELNATQWSTRQNYSLVINNKAEEINPSYMSRNNTSDYTLSFWYKVQERADSVSVFSSSKQRNDDAEQRFMRLGPEERFARVQVGSQRLHSANKAR